MAQHRWVTAPGTELRLEGGSVVVERKSALSFTHLRMPLSSVRWTGIVRVHRPWLLWSAGIGLVVAVLLTIGARDPMLSRVVGDDDVARWVWRLVAAPIVAYILTRRVRLVIGGGLDAHDVAAGPEETVGVDLWGGERHRDIALAFLQKLEWLAMHSERRRRRRTAFRRDVAGLREPELPSELATGADDAMKARALQYGTALGAFLVAMIISSVIPARATEPSEASPTPLNVPAKGKPRPVIGTATTQPTKAPVPVPAPPPTTTKKPQVALVASSFAASTAFSKGKEQHPAKDAFDGNPASAWCEHADGPGEGEWIEARFTSPQKIRELRLSTGWDYLSQYGDLFVRNSRYAKVTVTFDGGHAVTREVPADQRSLIIADLDVTASTVRIVATGVHLGKDPDLCISEIRILGEPAGPPADSPASPTADGPKVPAEKLDDTPF